MKIIGSLVLIARELRPFSVFQTMDRATSGVLYPQRTSGIRPFGSLGPVGRKVTSNYFNRGSCVQGTAYLGTTKARSLP